jgi:hypothetical protein
MNKLLYTFCTFFFYNISYSQSEFTYISAYDLQQVDIELYNILLERTNTASLVNKLKYQLKKQELGVDLVNEQELEKGEDPIYQFVFGSAPNNFDPQNFEVPCFGVSKGTVELLNSLNWISDGYDEKIGDWVHFTDVANFLKSSDCYTQTVIFGIEEDSSKHSTGNVTVVKDMDEDSLSALNGEISNEFPYEITTCENYYSLDNIDGIVLFNYHDTKEEDYPYFDNRIGFVKTIYNNQFSGNELDWETKKVITFSTSLDQLTDILERSSDWDKLISKAHKKVRKNSDSTEYKEFNSTQVKEISSFFLVVPEVFDNHFGQVIFDF